MTKGFTLVEVLAASLIMLPMTILVMQLVPRMLQIHSQSKINLQGQSDEPSW